MKPDASISGYFTRRKQFRGVFYRSLRPETRSANETTQGGLEKITGIFPDRPVVHPGISFLGVGWVDCLGHT